METLSTSVPPYVGKSEARRLRALHATRLVDSAANESFDRIVRLAAHIFNVPIVLISLIDSDRQWFKARIGLEITETPREYAFCDYTIRQADVLVIEDAALDPRFRANPLVTGEPRIRFYAGAPLILSSGDALGNICLIDRVPRIFSEAEAKQLKDLAAIVMMQIDLHRSAGRIDEVTQLPNHAQMTEDLAELALEYPGEFRTIFMVEAMDQKAVRDAVGAVGIPPVYDFLRDLTCKLQGLLAAKLKLYSVGVGRFAAILNDSPDEIDALVGQLIEGLDEPIESGNLLVEIDAVVGVVHLRLVAEEIRDVVRKTITTIYQAHNSELKVATYASEYDLLHQRAYTILRDIPRAIAQNEFYLVFQPKLCLSSGVYEGLEALLRWKHPTFGAIPPNEFIPLCEKTTLIHDITRWVIEASLSQLTGLANEGFPFVSVAVNVSGRTLERPHFYDEIDDALARHAIAPTRLQIECTEYSGLGSPGTLTTLRKISALGVKLALDDFGVGHSNLTCLWNLPFHTIKIDQSLVRAIVVTPRALNLLRGVARLGSSMGFELLAEGIETADILERVIELGFGHGQGYYIGRPMLPEDVIKFLKNPPLLIHSSAPGKARSFKENFKS